MIRQHSSPFPGAVRRAARGADQVCRIAQRKLSMVKPFYIQMLDAIRQ